MGCQICGRGACFKSLHSLEEQSEYDYAAGLSDYQRIREIISLRLEVKDLKADLEKAGKEVSDGA